jgi:hypothetical protein
VRIHTAVIAITLALVGCPKEQPTSDARLESSDGAGIVVAYAGKSAPVPVSDLGHGGPRVPVVRDGQGKRLAYPLPGGGSRIVYVVGDSLFLGPSSAAVRGGGTNDFSNAPTLEFALGAIFENAGARRALAVSEVKKELGDSGLAKMLADSAHVDDPEWDKAFAQLSGAARADLEKQLTRALEPGSPPGGLTRAVRFASLDDKSRAGAWAKKVRELLDPLKEPAAAAVLVRAIAKLDPGEGASLGCDVLHKKIVTKDASDAMARESLVEAAAIAVAHGKSECAAAVDALGENWCLSYFRCAKGKPLTGGETTNQDEPLCTAAELAQILASELERKPDDVMEAKTGTRAPLFAYAALAAKNRLPAAFTTAHERRRFALTQPKDPLCESGVTPGTACRCPEPVIRDGACRHRESATVSVGVCRFDVDDKQKKITNVVATLPP